jgi:type I restriction enzyme, S subunit
MAFIPGDAGMTSRIVKLGEVAEINPRSGAREFLEPESSVSFVSMSDISDVTFRIENETEKSFESTAKGYTAFERGDVLLAKITPCFENGKLAVADIQHPFGFGSTEFHVIRPRENRIDARFVYHVLRQEKIRIDGERKMTGSAGQRRVPKHFLEDLEIPLPPLEVQKRIASILDAADALRAKRRESLRKLEVLLKSVFLEMFGDPVTNPKGWEVRPFAEICDTRLGKMLDAKQQTGNHVSRYLRNSNVQWDRFELGDLLEMDFDDKDKREFSLRYGDLLICEGGAVGRAAIWREQLSDCYFQKALHRGRPKPDLATSEYLLFFLWYMANNGGLADFTTVATIAHLTGEKLRKVPTPVPPLELQNQFTNFYLEFQKKMLKAQSANTSLETLFSSLQDQAFNGTLDSTAPQLAQLEVQTSLF